MSITALPTKRKQLTPPKEKRRESETDVWLTGKEIARLTEPGHRRRTSEMVREFVERIMIREANGGNADG